VWRSYRRALLESQRSLVRLRDNRRGVVVFLLYVIFDKFPAYNGTCYYFNSYGPERYCIKSWAYFLAWAAASVPVVLGLLGYILSFISTINSIAKRIIPSQPLNFLADVVRTDKESGGYIVKIASMPHIVVGAVIGFFSTGLVNKFELFGNSCYYIGRCS